MTRDANPINIDRRQGRIIACSAAGIVDRWVYPVLVAFIQQAHLSLAGRRFN